MFPPLILVVISFARTIFIAILVAPISIFDTNFFKTASLAEFVFSFGIIFRPLIRSF